jgi:hypothetical protein
VPSDYSYQKIRIALRDGCRGAKGPFKVFSNGWYSLREWSVTPHATGGGGGGGGGYVGGRCTMEIKTQGRRDIFTGHAADTSADM